jgi:hypothetical protein
MHSIQDLNIANDFFLQGIVAKTIIGARHEHGLRPLNERIKQLEARCEQFLQENYELCERVNGLDWDVDQAADEMEIEEEPKEGVAQKEAASKEETKV